MRFLGLISLLFFVSCSSPTAIRDTRHKMSHMIPSPSVALTESSMVTAHIPQKTVLARLQVNVIEGLNCINQKLSLNITKDKKIVLTRDLDHEMTALIETDFDAGEHKMNLVDRPGRIIDSVTFKLSKEKDVQTFQLHACK